MEVLDIRPAAKSAKRFSFFAGPIMLEIKADSFDRAKDEASRKLAGAFEDGEWFQTDADSFSWIDAQVCF